MHREQMIVELKPATAVEFGAYVAAFNYAYRDYYVPVLLNPSSLRALIKRDSIDLSLSVAALHGNRVVGTALLAVRGSVAWIGGVGVIPPYRQQGIARQMMEYLLARAREHRLQQVRLEVIDRNFWAYHLYRQLGFQPERRLLTLERPSVPVHLVPGYRITGRDSRYALSFFDYFHDILNPWQRSHEALIDLAPNLQGWTIATDTSPDSVLGYSVGWIGSDGLHIMDIATSPASALRPTVVEALVSFIHRDAQELQGHLGNIAENDPAISPLLALGYREKMAQYEMSLWL